MKPPAIILAGGRSTRMGGRDKCLLPIGGKPLLDHILGIVRPQACDILINTNSDPAPFLEFGHPILPDVIADFQGPLSGLLTGMRWSRRRHPHAVHILSVASDTPSLPRDLVTKLAQALVDQNADIAIASCDEGTHPTIGLWPVDLAERLQDDLMETGTRSMHAWLRAFRVCHAEFPSSTMTNMNTLEDVRNFKPGAGIPSNIQPRPHLS